MPSKVKVLDLFAGPGGLGEGFSAFKSVQGPEFSIALSIEKEESAHRTLTLRSVFRNLDSSQSKAAYYAFMRGELGSSPEESLYQLPELTDTLEFARHEARLLELGQSSQSKINKAIRDAVGGDDCILIGGPPCQAYSLVGRSRNYGDKSKGYIAEEDGRNFLYREYLRVIARFQPLVFVMENVKGILSAKIGKERIFPRILQDLEDPCKAIRIKPDAARGRHRYVIRPFVISPRHPSLLDQLPTNGTTSDIDPREYIIRCENYGVPQERHRVILLGIREDIADRPDITIHPSTKPSAMADAIGDLPPLRSRLSKGNDSSESWRKAIRGIPRSLLKSSNRSEYADVAHMLSSVLDGLDKSPESFGHNFGHQRAKQFLGGDVLEDWYTDKQLGRHITNHEARGHINADLHRYMFYSCFAASTGTSPTSRTLPEALWPKHKNFSSGKFADRFRVQTAGAPGKTVTSHISKDGHYYIHYDPLQCRSLTVREAARIQTFPDNYHFVGSRTEQYVQVGNAVPPYLAQQLADVVSRLLS